jgi:hypothetical protein
VAGATPEGACAFFSRLVGGVSPASPPLAAPPLELPPAAPASLFEASAAGGRVDFVAPDLASALASCLVGWFLFSALRGSSGFGLSALGAAAGFFFLVRSSYRPVYFAILPLVTLSCGGRVCRGRCQGRSGGTVSTLLHLVGGGGGEREGGGGVREGSRSGIHPSSSSGRTHLYHSYNLFSVAWGVERGLGLGGAGVRLKWGEYSAKRKGWGIESWERVPWCCGEWGLELGGDGVRLK